MLERELQKLGFSEKESNVYLASIELGPAPVQKIAKKSKVNRATTYVIIGSLMEMGLMSTYEEGKKTFYVAEKPDRIMDFLGEKKNELETKIKKFENLLPELKSMFNVTADKPTVKYFEGVEGLRAVQRDFVETLKEGDDIYTFFPYDHFMELKPLLNMKFHLEKRLSKKIKMKAIYTSKKGRQLNYEKDVLKNGDGLRFVDYEKYPFDGGMNIYGNKVFMIDYRGKTGGIVIENSTLANLLTMMFKMIWDKA